MTPKGYFRNFGYERSRTEAFCTGLLAQSLFLSNEFSFLFLSKIAYGSSYCITSIECEKSIHSGRRPDRWIDVSEMNNVDRLPVLILLESKITSPETNELVKTLFGCHVLSSGLNVHVPASSKLFLTNGRL